MGSLSLRLANATLLPYDVVKYATDLDAHFNHAKTQVSSYYSDFAGFKASTAAISSLHTTANLVAKAFEQRLKNEQISKTKAEELNAMLLDLEKSFLYAEGMPYGDWYKSLYASSDPFSGYASWILPGIQYQIEIQNKEELSQWDSIYAKAIRDLDEKLVDILEEI